MREIDPLVIEYQHDRHRPRESEALTMLKKIASLVKPIMRRRTWKVGTLSEFYPHQQNLLGLNINKGQKICLRLRYPYDERQFLPLEQVVDTMLHELCHIVHGPHNREFHALWNQLRDEYEELLMKGYTGEGFLSEGKRLGGRRIPLHEVRRQAKAAAEQRRALSAGSGQRLGGAPVRGTDMRRVIADAAQRRIDVTTGCASGAENSNELAEEASRNGFRTKAEEDDANEQAIMQAYIDLIEEEERERYGPSYVPPSHENPAGPRSTLSPPLVPESTRPTMPSQPPEPIDLTVDDSLFEAPWTCPACTLENPASFLCCDACTAERPRPSNTRSVSGPAKIPSSSGSQNKNKRRRSYLDGQPTFKNRTNAVETLAALERKTAKRPLGWVCQFCETFMEAEWWTCSNCGTMKANS
ncbi:WLM domain-containing protein [Aspergillus pseudonomiae]|uniref:WLM domain-containing protein n=1 Tax=Aspergillus pseudonomiae TaxID=1506151 RepID=A0A5N7DHR3_9EURO|nr:WLM domain-containing protein [Aspergillus pseudonomiae]KAB8265613.1 WLM domain-containing protein [Aspergillus pseudonomiae]KAE8405659.1 WLM domain-containing protein [Aspergillus pseudonomiae]